MKTRTTLYATLPNPKASLGNFLLHPLATLGIMGLLASCSESSGTGGRQVVLPLQVVSRSEEIAAPRITSGGWSVQIESAALAFGPLYFYGPPRSTPNTPAFTPAPRRAHAGDDNLQMAPIMAEHLSPIALDLRAPEEIDAGDFLAKEGAVQSLSIVLDAPRANATQAADMTRGYSAWIAGRAEKEGRVLRFAGGIDFPDTPLKRRVDEVRVREGATFREGARVRLEVRPGAWLEQVDFDLLAASPAPPEGVYAIGAPSQFWNALFLGIRNPQSFALSIE